VRAITQLTLFGRIALGGLLGYVIGFEREYRGKSAGERTFALLAVGAAGVTGLGVLEFPASAEKVIAGVITGVGFLGAGLIFREDRLGQVHGLTTAASSWAAAAMGILAGAGAYLTAVLGTILVLLLLEADRSDLYRRWSPNKRRPEGSSEGIGGTDGPTVELRVPEEGDEPGGGST
jgi:putative Mg2+ transporter-C (MgtC) family protein